MEKLYNCFLSSFSFKTDYSPKTDHVPRGKAPAGLRAGRGYLPRPQQRRKIFFAGKYLFLLAMLFMYSPGVLAQSQLRLISADATGVDEYGRFIQFYVPVGDDGDDEKIDAYVYVDRGGGLHPIFRYSHQNDLSQHRMNIQVQVSGVRAARYEAPRSWGVYVPAGSSKTVQDVGALSEMYVRWYVPQEYAGIPLEFKVNGNIMDEDGDFKEKLDKYLSYGGSQSVVLSSPLPNANLSWDFSATEGKIAVNYLYSGTLGGSSSNIIRHWLNGYPDKVTDGTNVNPSGSIDVDRLNEPFTYTFFSELLGEGQHLTYTREQDIHVPAYIWPETLTASYDDKNKVTLSWDVPQAAGISGADYVDGDDFELERSTDPLFLNNTKTVVLYPYDPGKTHYEIEDDLRDLKGGEHLYYRLRRTASRSKWEWDVARKADLSINMNTSLDGDTVLLDETGGPKAVIRWEPFRGVWTTGTEFTIKKVNLTSGSTPETIKLTEEQARSGEYIDANITYCNEFVYYVAAVLGNNYDSPPETRIPGSILAIQIGTISDLSVSKGYFPDRSELRWSAQGVFDHYIIKRRIYGSGDEFVQVATVQGSSTGDIQADDTKGIPGVYYQYMVVGVVNCNNTNKFSRDSLYSVGFRSPTGNIYGRVTYENGQAVEQVSVRLEGSDNSRLGQSVYLDGSPGSYLVADSLQTPFTDSAFSIEAWVRPFDPSPSGQVVFSQEGRSELGFDGAGQLYFSYKGVTVTGAYDNSDQSFVHLAGIFTGDSLRLMLNEAVIGAVPCLPAPGGDTDAAVYIGRNAAGGYFSGYIDEMRAWNIPLGVEQVRRNYTRLMAGNEYGLAAYWRFDEAVADQFYDISNVSSRYNRNDGILAAGAIHSDVIPTPDQLSLKAYTDASGNYMISGIPFTGNGTTYTIVPTLGTHQFDPVSVNRLVSSSSLEFTVNFVDKSSFPVSGYVYYRNSTIPVKGVQFLIDGKYAQKENGQIIETDDLGKFTISVPVGRHEVRASKLNHVFVNGGRISDRFGNDLNYQGPVSERVLQDSTTVRFIGRVAGGVVQEAYPLGHSLSRNNLGEKLSVTLELTGEKNRKISTSPADSMVTVTHLLPSNQTDPSAAHRTRVNFGEYSITIYPDSITGEFAADVPPENFNVVSVRATGHDEIVDLPLNLNLTNAFFIEKEAHSYRDSLSLGGGEWAYTDYSDTVFYNYAYNFIERRIPVINVTQVDLSGNNQPFFGDTLASVRMFDGTEQEIRVYDRSADSYLFGYPVFRQNNLYRLKVSAYERYEYFEEADLQAPASVDQVPSSDGLVSFLNDIRYGAGGPDTLSLDQNGEGIYEFQAGAPELSDGIGRKGFSASVKIGSRTILWNNGSKLEGYTLGGKKTGNDFVTAGPNEVLRVLRDPPGSGSYAYFDVGTSTVTEEEYVGTVTQSGDEQIDALLGGKIVTFTGVGAGSITEAEIENTMGGRISHKETFTGTDKNTTVTEFLTRYQTSDDPGMVGAGADLFIGNSTNMTYGSTLDLVIVRNSEVKPGSDIVFFDGAAHGKEYSIIQRTGINLSQEFDTHFVYTAKHIEEVLIPNFIQIRNSVLLPPATAAAEAQNIANSRARQVYVSKLPPDDPRYGATNADVTAFGPGVKTEPWDDGSSYKIYFPDDPDYNGTDTIMILNQHIAGWKAELAKNEMMKATAALLENNYSFTGGGDIEYTAQASISDTYEKNFNIILGGSFLTTIATTFNKTGVKITIEEGVETEHGGNFSESTTNSKTFGFVLSEEGSDYISVDVFKAPDSTYIFRTKGGETMCPYEGGSVTKYFLPGTVLDQPTMQVEAPSITVEEPVVSDLPSTRKAAFVVQLHNASETERDVHFNIQVLDSSNPHGARIYMDGSELGTGRDILVQAGEVLYKTVTLERGPEAMEYEDIRLILRSACEGGAADTASISAFFTPSCSDVHIQSPADKWLLNTQSPVNDDQEYYLPIVIDQFDAGSGLFHHIDLQYKPVASSIWTSVIKFYADSAAYEQAQGQKALIGTGGEISYRLVMNDGSFSDQEYEIRAVSVCMDNGVEVSTTGSNIIRGIKDTYAPRLFGSYQPADGVLGIEDEIRLNFNEPIAAGLLSPSNFQVTGIRNGTEGDHSVSVLLDGVGDYLSTEFNKNLQGKDITVEMWVLPDGQQQGTLFSHGTVNASMELAFTGDNRLAATVGTTRVESDQPLPPSDSWAHTALVYDAAASTVSVFYNYVEVIHAAPVPPYSGSGPFEFGRSVSRQGDLFAGSMHEARIWTEALTGTRLQVNSLKRLSGAESNLLAYYPMTEGKGSIVFDKAHGSHASLRGSWTTPAGKALSFEGNGYLKLSTGTVPVSGDMDYTLELWFNAAPGQSDAALVSNGRGDGGDDAGSRDLFFLGFEDGLLTFRNNGFMIQAEGNYLDNDWHHLAIAVNRNSGRAQLFLDGVLNRYFETKDLGGIAASYMCLGARAFYEKGNAAQLVIDREFRGKIDELRLWDTYLDAAFIQANNNVRLNGREIGLLLYYPFEEYTVYQNNKELAFTLRDQKVQKDPAVVVPPAGAVNATETGDKAPVKDPGPVDNLQFDYVVNNDALIINLLEPRQAIDKTLITFKVDEVRDLNGNVIRSPVTWTAFIDRNQLSWSDSEFNLSKELYKPMEFESYILNSAGTAQHFRLDRLPPWLRANPSEGTIAPQGRQKVVFTVNAGLNVGAYDEIIYMRNDDNETQSLPVTLKVKGEEPAWEVDPAAYRYSMTVYGKLRVNGIFSDNPEDMLAAFAGGQCVGVARSEYNEANDLWYAFLTIYSNTLEHDGLSFRLWDAGTGKIYEAVPSGDIPFLNDAITGTAREPVIFDGREVLFREIKLNQGWNWISFNLASPRLDDVGTALSEGQWEPGDMVKNEELGFDQYSSSEGWVGYLPGFNNSSLFMLSTAKAQALGVSGTAIRIDETPIPIRGGRWNYISYLPGMNMTVAEALAGYEASEGDVIKSQTGFAMYDPQTGWIGSLAYMEPGKGYMLYREAQDDAVLYYPAASGGILTAARDGQTFGEEQVYSEKQAGGEGRAAGVPLRSGGEANYPGGGPVASHFEFAENMTVVAAVEEGFALRPGDRLLAYADGRLRGEARQVLVDGIPRFFLTVSGKEEIPVHFEILRAGGEKVRSATVITYRSDSRTGTAQDPLVVRMENESAKVIMYPNPFGRLITVSGEIKKATDAYPAETAVHEVRLLVYDLSGGLVYERIPERVKGERFTIDWNGRNTAGRECPPGVYFIHVVIDGSPLSGKVIKVDSPK